MTLRSPPQSARPGQQPDPRPQSLYPWDPFEALLAQHAKIARIADGLGTYCGGRTPVTHLISSRMLVELARAVRLSMDAVRRMDPGTPSGTRTLERVGQLHAALARAVAEAEGATVGDIVDRRLLARCAGEMSRMVREVRELDLAYKSDLDRAR